MPSELGLLSKIAGFWPNDDVGNKGLTEHRSVAAASVDTPDNDTLDPGSAPAGAFLPKGAANIELRAFLGAASTGASGDSMTLKIYGWAKDDADGNQSRGAYLGILTLTVGTGNEAKIDNLNPITGDAIASTTYYEAVSYSDTLPDNIKAFTPASGAPVRFLLDVHDYEKIYVYVTAATASTVVKVGLRRVN